MINLEFSGSLDDFFEGFIKLHQESPSLAWATLAWLVALSIFGLFVILMLCSKMKCRKCEIARKAKKNELAFERD